MVNFFLSERAYREVDVEEEGYGEDDEQVNVEDCLLPYALFEGRDRFKVLLLLLVLLFGFSAFLEAAEPLYQPQMDRYW